MNLRHDYPAAGATMTASGDEKLAPQVLVVDDSAEVRELVARLLRLRGYRVLKAANGAAAQRILKTEHPALVISDLEMPVCDGWDVIDYCHTWHPDLPVLIVSGAPLGRRPEVEGWAAGYLPKPFNRVRFDDTVDRLICRAA